MRAFASLGTWQKAISSAPVLVAFACQGVFLGYTRCVHTTEHQLLDALLTLNRTVAELRTAGAKPNLLTIFEHIDRLAAELPADTPPELRHYLQRKSYDKAREFLLARADAA